MLSGLAWMVGFKLAPIEKLGIYALRDSIAKPATRNINVLQDEYQVAKALSFKIS